MQPWGRSTPGAAQYHHRPSRPFHVGAGFARFLLFQGRRYRLMHAGRIGTLDEKGLVSVTAKQKFHLSMRDAGQNGGVGDLTAGGR
jgi:hypothetical protein